VGKLTSPIHPFASGVTQRCPECGLGKIFVGLLTVQPQCPHCGFDLQKADPGDGPAFLVITFLGFLITGLAVWVELAIEPEFWIHAMIWIPLTLGLTPYLLRLTKSLLISYQYYYKIGL